MAAFFNFKRIPRLITALRSDARVLWHAAQHPQAPRWLKPALVLLALYVVSPVDLIPDVILVLGWLDDVLIVGLAMRWLLARLPAHVREDAMLRATGRRSAARAEVIEVVD
jgi:uncharacterized membrane protein YkvA (DUF1232 family)